MLHILYYIGYFEPIKGIVHQTNKNYAMIYSPSSHPYSGGTSFTEGG